MEQGGGPRKMLRAPTDLVWHGRAGHSLLSEVLQAPGHLVPASRGPSVPHCHGQEGPPSEPTGVTRPLRESRRAGHSAAQWWRVMALMLISEPGEPVPRMLSTPARTATYPVAHTAAEALGAWQARVPQATLPALQTKTSWSAPTGSPAGALPA